MPIRHPSGNFHLSQKRKFAHHCKGGRYSGRYQGFGTDSPVKETVPSVTLMNLHNCDAERQRHPAFGTTALKLACRGLFKLAKQTVALDNLVIT